MSETGDAVAATAQLWKKTPWHWQGSQRGVGADCKGLVAGVARDLGRPEAESLYAMKADYGRDVDTVLLREGLAALFDEVDEPEPGDVLLMWFGGKVQHLGIATKPGWLIHTYGRGVAKVVEQRINHLWPVDSIWRWRE